MNDRLRIVLADLAMARGTALGDYINNFGMRTQRMDPASRGPQINAFFNQPAVIQWLKINAENILKTDFPTLDIDDRDDVISDAMISFWRSTLPWILKEWRADKGLDFVGFVRMMLKKAVNRSALQSKKKGNNPANQAVSLDDPRTEGWTDKHVDPRDQALSYKDLAPGTDYKALLAQINLRLKQIDQVAQPGYQTRLLKQNLLQLKSEITERQNMQNSTENRFYVDGAFDARPAPNSSGVSVPNAADSDDIEARMNVLNEDYAGMPDYIHNNAALTGLLQKKLKGRFQSQRLPVPLTFTKHMDHRDPETHAKLSRILMGAMIEVKHRMDATSRHGVEDLSTGQVSRSSYTNIKPFLISVLQQRMQTAGIAPEDQAGMVGFVQKINYRELIDKFYNLDELMRFYQYDRARKALHPDREWDQIDDTQANSIRDQAAQAMNYGQGGNMYVRRQHDQPLPTGKGVGPGLNLERDLSALRRDVPQDVRYQVMNQEIANLRGPNQGYGLSAGLPADSEYFHKSRNKVASVGEMRIAVASDWLRYYALEHEADGAFHAVDRLDNSIRTAMRMLSD